MEKKKKRETLCVYTYALFNRLSVVAVVVRIQTTTAQEEAAVAAD